MNQEIDMDQLNKQLEEQTAQEDAGIRASETLRKRSVAKTATRYALGTFLFVVLALVVAVGAAAYSAYTGMTVKEVTDSRPCKLKVGDHLITGVREYTKPEYRTFGLSFTKSEEVEEVTKLDVEYVPMTILGITEGNGWDLPIVVGAGEKGYQVLPPADIYTFFVKDAAVAVQYGRLCK